MLSRAGKRPNNDCCVQRSTGDERRIGRPRDLVYASIVEAPFLVVSRLQSELIRNRSSLVPQRTHLIVGNSIQNNFPVAVARNKILVVRRISAVSDESQMFELNLQLQLSAVQSINVNLVVITADSDFARFRIDGNATGLVANGKRQNLPVVLNHHNLLDASDDDGAVLLQDVHSAWLTRKLQVDSSVRVALDVDLLESVVDAASVGEVAMRSHAVNLIAMTVSFDTVVHAATRVPVGDGAIVRGCVDDAAIVAQRDGSDGLVVTFDNLQWLRRIRGIKIINEARERHGQHMLALP